jgi:hypothetical protein
MVKTSIDGKHIEIYIIKDCKLTMLLLVAQIQRGILREDTAAMK